MKFRENEHIVLGIPILFLSFLSLGFNTHSILQYNFTDKLFLFIAPNIVLIINLGIAILGVILGIETIKNSISVKLSLIIFLCMLLIYILLNTFIIQLF